jgi:hypothetical protein
VPQIKPYFVKITFSQPTDGQPLTACDFPFTVMGTITPVAPATTVTIGGWDVDDGLVFLMTLLGGSFSFQIDDPGTLGPHLITVFTFDDSGELSESSVSFLRV